MDYSNYFQKLVASLNLRLWIALLVAAVFSELDIMQYWHGDTYAIFHMAGLGCLAVCKATLLTVIWTICRKCWVRWVAGVVITGFFLLSFLNGFCYVFYGFGITRKLFTIICETNGNEVTEFLPELGAKLRDMLNSWWFIIIGLVVVALWKFLPIMPRHYFFIPAVVISILGAVYFAYIMLTADWGKANTLVYARTYRCVSGMLHNRKVMRELQSTPRSLPHPDSLDSRRLARKVVVVIGESASRDHLSLYGYPLPTTPVLDSIHSDLYIFTDAVASSTSTAENIPRLLSFMTDEPGGGEWYDYPTILQLLKLGGYHTVWLSNQERTGEYSNLSGILSGDADVVKYLGCEDSEDHLTFKYDEVLLPAFRETLQSSDSLQFTLLHLMGSHFQYHNRMPADRKVFKPQDILKSTPRKWLNEGKASVIADYDNSIRYTDSILGVVVNELARLPEPALMVYVSDHGENVYDDRDFRGRDAKFVRVPFVIYANDAYRIANPDISADLKAAVARPFSTSELPQMLMHLTGTRYFQYDSIRDPLSTHFRQRARYVDGDPASVTSDSLRTDRGK